MTDNQTAIPEDALEIYREHITVITEIKNSQWKITNYIIIIIAGVLALKNDIILAIPDEYRLYFGIFAPLIFWLFGSIVLWKQHEGLMRRRERIKEARKLLSKKAQDVFGDNLKEKAGYLGFLQIDALILGVCIVVTGAATLVCMILLTA